MFWKKTTVPAPPQVILMEETMSLKPSATRQAVVPVRVSGVPAWLSALYNWTEQPALILIDDASLLMPPAAWSCAVETVRLPLKAARQPPKSQCWNSSTSAAGGGGGGAPPGITMPPKS